MGEGLNYPMTASFPTSGGKLSMFGVGGASCSGGKINCDMGLLYNLAATSRMISKLLPS